DTGEVLERTDVAPLPADDAPLHVIGGKLDDGYRGLGSVAGRQALHGDGEDRPHAPLRVALRLLLDVTDDPGGVVARLVLDLLQECVLGLSGAQPGGALQRAGVLLAQGLELAPR